MSEGRNQSPQPQSNALWVARLKLTAFRCYEAAELVSDGRPLVLTGPNGAGKTNLLEALSFFAPGRGLRRARLSEIDRRLPGEGAGETPWAVAAEIETPQGRRSLGTGRDPAPGPREKRVIKLDGDFLSNQQSLSELLAVLWLTPAMDRLFLEGPGERRRFLDRLVFGADPAHAGRITAYENALRERSRLLRGELGKPDPAWLSALEETLAGQGVAIAAARCAMTERLASACAAAEGPFPRAGLAVAGELEALLGQMKALEVEDRFRERLEASRTQDAESGGAAQGPHRSDLRVRHLERGREAELCSTGEQKALLISIVLAHARLIAAERGQKPLLLLDEVAAHLDETRRAALYEELTALGAQTWLTGTDSALFAAFGERAQHFRVEGARITRA
ncbi:DNA replication/repair protein RecF [Limibacillus halophilus]